MNDKPVIVYDDERHEYHLGDKLLPSVTQLASEFSKLNKEYFAAHPEYAIRGTQVHQELQDYYEGVKPFEMLSELAADIAGYMKPDDRIRCEVIVYNTELGYAGTADIVYLKGMTVGSIVDIKTGRTRNTMYERCQLSLYLLALKSMGYNTDNTCLFVLSPDGYTKYEPLSWEQMQKLEVGDLDVADDNLRKIQRYIARLEMLKVFADEYNDVEHELKQLLLGEFEAKNANTFVYDNYKFSYTKPSVRKSVDTAAMKKAGVYDQFIKETEIPAGVRLTKKEK